MLKQLQQRLAPYERRLADRLLAYGRGDLDPDDLNNWDPALIRKLLPWICAIRDHYYRGEVEGLENIPAGRYILAGMHGGGPMTVLTDNLVLYASFYEHFDCRRPLYAMGHHLMFSAGPIGRFCAAMGAMDGKRENALRVLDAEEGFVVYPGGEEDMGRTWWERNRVDFRGHAGFVRSAIIGKAPIVPMGSIGGHETEFVLARGDRLAHTLHLDTALHIKSWPLALTLPWGITPGYVPYVPFPARINIRIGEPIHLNPSKTEAFDEGYQHAVRDQVEAEVQRLTDELVAERAAESER